MINLIRVDDRLIHGQAQIVLIKKYDAQDIIVIDDYTASNEMLKNLMKNVVPAGVRVVVLTEEKAPAALKKAATNDRRVLVLTRVPSVYVRCFREVPEMPKELNIASVQAKGADMFIHDANGNDLPPFHVTQAEVDAIKEIAGMGVHIYLNLVPGRTELYEWDNIKGKN
ncbi:MAG: PTS sugar transporter subunit IIB [Erysipelotrichaceae bacterium]|nr:PTS sugar transporter subunit IIB [Erysipelotrichaceae bacterium]